MTSDPIAPDTGPRAPTERLGNRVLALAAAAVFFLVSLPSLIPLLGEDAYYIYTNDWFDLPLIVMAFVYMLLPRNPGTGRREIRFWRSIAFGWGAWIIGRLVWGILGYYGLLPSLVSDLLFTVLYIALVVALETRPETARPSPFEKRMRRYTITGAGILLVTVFLYFGPLPALLNTAAYNSWAPATVGNAVFDIYLLIRFAIRWRRTTDPHWRRVYLWLSVAFAGWVCTDTMNWMMLLDREIFLHMPKVFDLDWLLPNVVMIGAVLVGRAPHAEPVQGDKGRMLPRLAGSTPLVAYAFIMPLLHATLWFGGLGDPLLAPARSVLLVIESVLLGAIIFRTHRMIIAENRSLHQKYERVSGDLAAMNRKLEERVRVRTAELESLNRELAADIAARKQIEDRLREAQAHNRVLIESLPDFLLTVDADGIVREVYPGRGPDELDLARAVGQPLDQRLPSDAGARLGAALKSAHPAARTIAFSLERTGHQLHFELRVEPCGDGAALVLVQDTTERQEVHAALQQTQKLESLGVLAGGIAHDFNNLLTIILGNLQLVRDDMPDVTLNGPLAAIESSATRAAKLTGSLLAYAGEAHIQVQPLDLAALMRDLDPLLATAVGGGVACSIDGHADGLWVKGNEAQLTQVVLNLVRNAAESLRSTGGAVALRMERRILAETAPAGTVAASHDGPGEFVRIEVTDNGIGMSEEIKSRIFDPFYTTKETGRGLGLAAVLGIIRNHRGLLTLDSAPGQGTTFSIYLPCCTAPETIEDRSSTPSLGGEGLILVVDDEHFIRTLVTRYLGSLGFTAVTARDGAEGVDMVRANAGDLVAVLMDFSMPRMSGAEATRRIRAEHPELPIVMMSGFGERGALKDLAGVPRSAFLQKPFRLSDLAATLGALLPDTTSDKNGKRRPPLADSAESS